MAMPSTLTYHTTNSCYPQTSPFQSVGLDNPPSFLQASPKPSPFLRTPNYPSSSLDSPTTHPYDIPPNSTPFSLSHSLSDALPPTYNPLTTSPQPVPGPTFSFSSPTTPPQASPANTHSPYSSYPSPLTLLNHSSLTHSPMSHPSLPSHYSASDLTSAMACLMNPPMVSCSLYVKNLPPETDKLYLYEKFAPYGAILSVKVLNDPETKKCRGVGFINYTEHNAALKAIQALHGTHIAESRTLHVSLQAPRNRPLP